MEILDVLTADGDLTGRMKSKTAIHREGEWHMSVHIWIQRPDGALLMQRRAPQKENDPNRWDVSVAGHVMAGESLRNAALRETQEEIGLTLPQEAFQPLFRLPVTRTLNQGTYLDNEWHQVYLVSAAPQLSDLTLQTEEVADVRWVSWDDFVEALETRPSDWVPHWPDYAVFRALITKPPGK